MKVALMQSNQLEYLSTQTVLKKKPDQVILKVIGCAVCRTDAKMWRDGHRDLALPRVLGHEIAGIDESCGKLYTVWPGQVCGTCSYCLQGRENLCEEMKIIGFHSDGGFCDYVAVPRDSLISGEGIADPLLLTFCEPVACVINGLSRLSLKKGERVIIYGGGVVGLLAALVFSERGVKVTIVERSEAKISTVRSLCKSNTITICKDTVESEFDIAFNCCDSHIAFSLCITKLRKGGRFGFFSGLEKNEELDTNLVNLMHYKELELYGSYGPRRDHMVEAVKFCKRHEENLNSLIERIISPHEIESVLPEVLTGQKLKYIVDFRDDCVETASTIRQRNTIQKESRTDLQLSQLLEDLVAKITLPRKEIANKAQKKVDLKTKPLGSLGRLEDIGVKLSTIQESLTPTVDCKRLYVFAGDHGVVEEGVSAFPSKVTVQMVENFLEGGAAINVFCRQYGIELGIVDIGVNGNFEKHPQLISRKVAKGTENFTIRQAMSHEQALLSIESGAKVFLEANQKRRCHLLGLGEMGIGNTSSASAIIAAASGLSVEQVVGRGTGVDDQGLARKREVIGKALTLHNPSGQDGLQLLETVGGYELGGICGAVLAAASEKCCVVLDGVISTAAGLIAYLICPEVKEYLIAGHKSVEIGQKAALEIMGLDPILDLDFRLGEGTGAAITMNLVELAGRMVCEMASFEEAGVDSGGLTS